MDLGVWTLAMLTAGAREQSLLYFTHQLNTFT